MAEPAKIAAARPRLGRGLSSLISNSKASDPLPAVETAQSAPVGAYVPVETPPAKPDGEPIHQLAPAQIATNPYQPRKDFKEDRIAELAESILHDGILQPLVVAKAVHADAEQPYVLIAGERRLRAAQRIGLATVPCIVRTATQQQMLEWAIIENIQRDDLNPIERGQAFRECMDRFSLSAADLGLRLGLPRTTVSNYLRILELSEDMRSMVVNGDLSFGHAKILAGLAGQPQRQLELAHRVLNENLSVRQLETIIADNAPVPVKPSPVRLARPAYLKDLEEQLAASLGTRVSIHPGRAKHTGKVLIEYRSLDDFDRLAARLGAKIDT